MNGVTKCDEKLGCLPRGDEESLSERIGLPLSARRVFYVRVSRRIPWQKRYCVARSLSK